MQNHLCATCGSQFSESVEPPPRCPICEDERQFVSPEGQSWTTLDDLRRQHRNVLTELEPGLTEIITEPKFGIGQRALLVKTPAGNVLWDCLSLIDDATIEAINKLGGIASLAMSHPHMYGSMVEWSYAFGHSPIHLHAANQRWVMRPDPVVEFWGGESHRLDQGVALHCCGGHFTGATALLWPEGAQGRGVLLTSDTMYVAPSQSYVSFMYSYANYIPMSGPEIDSVVDKVAPLRFDRIYSHLPGLVINQDAKLVLERSVERYKKAIGS